MLVVFISLLPKASKSVNARNGALEEQLQLEKLPFGHDVRDVLFRCD
jgi:hypothetical protein